MANRMDIINKHLGEKWAAPKACQPYDGLASRLPPVVAIMAVAAARISPLILKFPWGEPRIPQRQGSGGTCACP
jgi:hypothetical protein